MNKHLIEFLVALKNASLFKKPVFIFSVSNQIIKITECLYREGLIQSYKYDSTQIRINIRSFFNKVVLKNLRIISTPSNPRYLGFSSLLKLSLKKFTLFLSTSKGLLTLNECKKVKIGGKALFII